jgi:WD40 repeat protein
LWDVPTGKAKAILENGAYVFTVAFSPDGAILASGGRLNGMIKLWDVKTGKEITTHHGHTDPVTCVAFSPNGTLLASGDYAGRINLWEMPVSNKADK